MSHSKHSVLIAAALALSSLMVAAPAAAQTKIAAIKSGDLIMQSPQFKAGQEKMKAEFDKRGKDLEADAKKFQDDVAKFKKEADIIAPTERAKREKDLGARQVDLSYKQKQLAEDVQNRDRQLTQEMQAKIKDVIVAVAKEKGYDIVVQDPVYAANSVDITADVLKKLQATK